MTVPDRPPSETENESLRRRLRYLEGELARARDRRSDERRRLLGGVLLGGAILSVVLTLIFVVATNVAAGDRRRDEIARRCVELGGAWVANSCVPRAGVPR